MPFLRQKNANVFLFITLGYQKSKKELF